MTDIINQLRQASLSKEDYRWEAADLIQSLREKTQYWPDNAERDAVIRYQKEEIERLRAANDTWASAYHAEYYENERLREDAEFNYMTGFDVAKNQYCKMVQELEDENERLFAQLQRLREALKPILNYPNIREKIGNQLYDLGCAALGFTPAPGKEGA